MAKEQSTPIQIILIEDFHAETEMLLRELRDAELRFEHRVARSEEEFTQLLDEFDTDVILSPYSLKGTNALKLLGLARSKNVDGPFILLAFDLSEDIAIDLLAEGVEDYIQRSTIKRLPVAIKKALQRYKTQLELKISEQKIRSSEESLRGMVRDAPIAVAMFDMNMDYLMVSEFWLQHEGKTSDIIGKNHYEVVPEIRDSWKSVHQRVLKGEILGSEREKMHRADGTTQILRWKMNPWFDSEGQIGGAVLFIEDITESITTKEQLEKDQRLLAIGEELGSSGSFELDLTTQTPRWSENMYKIKGFDPSADISHKEYIKHVHPDDKDTYLEGYSKILEFVAPERFEYRLIRPDNGKVVHLRVHSAFIRNAQGEHIALVGSVQDVSLIKKAQESLAESEASLKAAQKIAKVGSWEWTKGDLHVQVSDQMYEIYEIEKKQLTLSDIRSFIHPEDKARVKKETAHDLDEKIKSVINYRVITPNGTVKHVVSKAKQLFQQNGEVYRLIGTLQDVTDKVETELKLKAEHVQRELTLQATQVGVWHWIIESHELVWDDRCFEIFGKEPFNLTVNDFLSFVHPNDREQLQAKIAEAMITGEYQFDYRIDANGKEKLLHGRAKTTYNNDGLPIRLDGIIIDNTNLNQT